MFTRRRLVIPFLFVGVALLSSCGYGLVGRTTNITAVSATLNGLVDNTEPGRVTYWFEYSTSTESGTKRTEAATVDVSGPTPVAVDVDGLSPGQTYVVNLCVEDSAGHGVCDPADETFATFTGAALTVDDLAGSFTGDNRAICEADGLGFEVKATYTPSTDVGGVSINIWACFTYVPPPGRPTFGGGFSIETSAGSLSGYVCEPPRSAVDTIYLCPSEGTGTFAGVRTVLQVEGIDQQASPVTGTLSVAGP